MPSPYPLSTFPAVALVLGLFIAPGNSGHHAGVAAPATEADQKVYICRGPESARYHYKSDCQGLNRCSKSVDEIDLLAAKKLGRSLCGFED